MHLNNNVLIVVAVVVVVLAIGLYFLLKKENYSSEPQSAVITLTIEGEDALASPEGQDQMRTAIDNLHFLLGNIQIKVVGPSPVIPDGYNGALVVYYPDGSTHVRPFGKTLPYIGNDLVHLARKYERMAETNGLGL